MLENDVWAVHVGHCAHGQPSACVSKVVWPPAAAPLLFLFHSAMCRAIAAQNAPLWISVALRRHAMLPLPWLCRLRLGAALLTAEAAHRSASALPVGAAPLATQHLLLATPFPILHSLPLRVIPCICYMAPGSAHKCRAEHGGEFGANGRAGSACGQMGQASQALEHTTAQN